MEPDTPATFEATFRPDIRVCFNWNRFRSEQWPIEAVRVSDREVLGECVLPWYLGRTGQEVAFDQPGAVPIRLAQIPEVVASLAKRQTGIEEYTTKFRAERQVEFSVPTYNLGNRRHLALDGNHRLSALILASVSFAVTFWCVGGPLDARCLPDLIHWHGEQDAEPHS